MRRDESGFKYDGPSPYEQKKLMNCVQKKNDYVFELYTIYIYILDKLIFVYSYFTIKM